MLPRWQPYANRHFLKGIDNLCLNPEQVPNLADVNRFLSLLTGSTHETLQGGAGARILRAQDLRE